MEAQIVSLLYLFVIVHNLPGTSKASRINDGLKDWMDIHNLPGTSKASRINDGLKDWMDSKISRDFLNIARSKYTPIKNVEFLLFTQNNPASAQKIQLNDIGSVRRSYFDYHDPTRIIIHGWNSKSDLEVVTLIRDAYLSIGPHNIVVVDWSEKSLGKYPLAVFAIPDVAYYVAAFIDFMVGYGYLEPENLVIVGHSLGAHISGNAARIVRSGQIHTIVALDPAKILLPYYSSESRIRSTDAYYVESIQTNGAFLAYEKPIGRATFYPNGGQIQPGCELDLDIGCSHYRSYEIFAEAVRINGFPSIQCSDYIQAKEKKCGGNYSENVRMGASSNADIARGVFYVPTRARSPYAGKSTHSKSKTLLNQKQNYGWRTSTC